MIAENEFLIFCNNVKHLREVHGLSKREMAKRLHVGVKTLEKLECGIFPDRLGVNILFRIHREFGIPPARQLRPLNRA